MNDYNIQIKELEKITGFSIESLLLRLKEGSLKVVNPGMENPKDETYNDLSFVALRRSLMFLKIMKERKKFGC